jgi:DNA-binding CsgD family transcriptional regulator
MTAVVGRERELAIVERFLSHAHQGYAVLVLEGEAGIGKTTVWREALRFGGATGLRVVSCRPALAEVKLAFASLADLLAPVEEDVFSALPEPQKNALDVALLRSAPGSVRVDPRAVATALTSVLTHLAEMSPLVVAIDDAQWLDRASAAALSFAVRRIEPQSRVALLVALRIEGAVGADVLGLEQLRSDQLERIRLGPLNLSGLYHVLREQLQLVLPRPTLQRIQRASGGNPLFALEIGRLLSERGIPPIGEPLPVPSDVEALLRRRIRKMPPGTREVLLAAASLAEPRAETVRTAVGRAIDSDLEPAERAEIVRLMGDSIGFAHPLFASAMLSLAGAAERRDNHRRLAAVVDDLEERARHLALATERRDETVARLTHEAAHHALYRGAPGAAAELVELALCLTAPSSEAEPGRLLDLARYLYAASEPERAWTVLEAVQNWERWPSQLRAEALELLGILGSYVHVPTALAESFERTLHEELPPQAQAVVHLAVSYNAGQLDAERALERAEAGIAILERLGGEADPAILATALMIHARAQLICGYGLDRDVVARVLDLEAQLPPERVRAREFISAPLAFWFKYVDDLDASRSWLTRHLDETSGTGYEMFRAVVLTHLADTECFSGNLRQAREHASSAFGVAQELEAGQLSVLAAIALARAEACLGNVDEARGLGERFRDAASDAAGRHIGLEGVLGLLDLSTENYDAADEHLRSALARFEQAHFGEPAQFRVHADAAEAAVALGEVERAATIADFLEVHGRRTKRRSSLTTAARVRALVAAAQGDLDAALGEADRALAQHGGLPMPVELGRNLLVKGVIERRLRRRADAKLSFNAALEIFDRTGARLWAERVRSELARLGLHRSSSDELTESERRVAELTARGMTRREVAAALYVSPKTVDATLVRVYRKLGVHSRAELGAHMVDLIPK